MENYISSLGHMPHSERWVFDESVTAVFPDMLRRSIPQYDVMRKTVYDIGTGFVQPRTQIVDLGCSRGDALAPFMATYGTQNNFLGIDVSPSMLEVSAKRFEKEIKLNMLNLASMNLTLQYPEVNASLTLSILTLQFIPLEFRQRILQDIYRTTLPGGALLLVEKVLGSTVQLNELMIQIYHHLKNANGYTAEEIKRKSRALRDVLVPVTADQNVQMLRSAGFQEVDCFWRWMNFAGYIAVKRRT